MKRHYLDDQPEWISHYLETEPGVYVPVARVREYAGNASTQRKRRERERTA